MSERGDILPASEGTLIYFASGVAWSVRHGTTKLYFAAVRNLHICCGHGDPLQGKLLLGVGCEIAPDSEGYANLSRPVFCWPFILSSGVDWDLLNSIFWIPWL